MTARRLGIRTCPRCGIRFRSGGSARGPECTSCKPSMRARWAEQDLGLEPGKWVRFGLTRRYITNSPHTNIEEEKENDNG